MHTRQRSMRRTGVRRLLYPSLWPVLPLFALLCSVTLLTVVAAQSPLAGDLDPTFDDDGIVVTNINNYDLGNDLAIQSDGKIVVVGGSGTFTNTNFTVTRYNSDGSLDAGFGSSGIIVTAVGDSSIANAVALQSDGKIVVVGGDSQWFTSSHRMIVVRYNSDGGLDNTFGSGGIVTLAIGGVTSAEDVVIQPDGKIVVAGYSYIVAASFTFVRLNLDGSLDSTFDSDGVFVVPQSSNARPTYGRALALQTDGKIVAAGIDGGGQTSDIAVIRCNSDGSLDSTFGSGGMVFTNISDQQKDTANDLAIQPDGKIVVVGTSALKTNSVAVLARYNTDGSLDTSFGKNGRVAPPIYVGAAGSASGVTLQTDGKILIAQGRDLLLFGTFSVSRYQTNGSPDSTFGTFGTVTTAIGYVATAAAVAFQPDGRIVAAGTGNFRSDNPTLEIMADIAVVRYYPVANNYPEVTITRPVSGSAFAVNTPVNFTGTFTDDVGDTHTAQWNFNSISQPATVIEPSGSTPGSADTTYTFNETGVYKVTLTVTDNGNFSRTAETVDGLEAMVVIYDPNAGFVTGGGWINSPPDAFVPMPELTGKVSFGFVSQYLNGAMVPTGNIEFQFKAGNLNFSSTSYQWLVISGGRKAQYKGFGTINGSGNYYFILTAIDGDQPGGDGQDKFRMQIWTDTNDLIYDNQLNAPDSDDPTSVLGGGSIVIHH